MVEQLVVNLLSLCAFPFATRPMITTAFGLSDNGFDQLMSERADALIDFVMSALRL